MYLEKDIYNFLVNFTEVMYYFYYLLDKEFDLEEYKSKKKRKR